MSVGIRDPGFGIGESQDRVAARYFHACTEGQLTGQERAAWAGSFDESRIPNLESLGQTP